MIVVALATYNGSRYLPELVASLQGQTCTEWTLLVSDDNSTDGTPDLVRRLQRTESRIVLLPAHPERLGVVGNFHRVAAAAFHRGAGYVAFADQDDVWHPEKLDVQRMRMRAEEESAGPDEPVLVHSNSEVVDKDLRTISSSLHQFNGQCQNYVHPLRHLLLHADVTGCTMFANRALMKFALPIPAGAVQHDWWISLCAAACGRIAYIDRPLLKYRQHDSNCIGTFQFSLRSIAWQLMKRRVGWDRGMQTFRQSLSQAAALKDRMAERGLADSPEGREVAAYCRLIGGEPNRLRRVLQLYRLGIPEVHWLRKIISTLRFLALSTAESRRALENTTKILSGLGLPGEAAVGS